MQLWDRDHGDQIGESKNKENTLSWKFYVKQQSDLNWKLLKIDIEW